MAESVYFGGRGGGGVDGAPGANGTDGTAFNFRLDFSSTGSYATKDTVHNSGSIYVCIAANIGSGVLNTNFWNLFARSGSPGAVGLVGLTGVTGGSGLPGADGQPGASGAAGLSGTPQILPHLSDTSVASPTVGHLLKYSAGLAWGGAADNLSSGGGGAILTFPEVNPTGLQANELLMYDSGFAMWKPKFTSFPVWDVRDFGASGDGVSNDLAAVIAARNAMNSSGGTLYFPAGFYRCIITTSNSGTIYGKALLSMSRDRVQIVSHNEAHVQILSEVSVSGASIAPAQIPMFAMAAHYCRVQGGTYSFTTTGVNVLYSGDGYNGFPLYHNGNSYGNSFENCLMSGFAGGSLNGGLNTNGIGEQIENTYWRNCTFVDWGGAYHDNLIYHQGRVTFDNCRFIQRAIFIPTGVDAIGNTSVKNHSHALYNGSRRPYATYKNCLFKNIGGGPGNRANIVQFFGSIVGFLGYGVTIDGCSSINTTKGFLFDGTQDQCVVSNHTAGWTDIGGVTTSLTYDGNLGGGLFKDMVIYNTNATIQPTTSQNLVINNLQDANVAMSIGGHRNVIVTNGQFKGANAARGRNLAGWAGPAYMSYALYGGKNMLIANCLFEHVSARWVSLIRSTYNLNGYAFIDNCYSSSANGGTTPLRWENTQSRHCSIIGCNFYNSSTSSPIMLEFSSFVSGLILLGNVFNTPNVTTAAGTASVTLNGGSDGVMMKNNSYVNGRASPLCNAHYYNIGNFYYSGGIGGTGTALLSVYNTLGVM
jgi:hypothetical protein